jgi:hypothetical protein
MEVVMDCYRCKHRDDESKEINECYEKLYQIAMNGLIRGDRELTDHVLFEIKCLHQAIRGNITRKIERENGPEDLSV